MRVLGVNHDGTLIECSLIFDSTIEPRSKIEHEYESVSQLVSRRVTQSRDSMTFEKVCPVIDGASAYNGQADFITHAHSMRCKHPLSLRLSSSLNV